MAPLTTALCALIAAGLTTMAEARGQYQVAPGHFDFYVLSQSWQPEFCHGQANRYPGCNEPQDFWRTHFTMHGLWPEMSSGSHPENCTAGPDIPDSFDARALVDAIGMDDLLTYWPNVKEDVNDQYGDYPQFWQHEWETHGTCSGLGLVDFFRKAINMLKSARGGFTPDFVQQNVGRKVAVKDLQTAFGGAQRAAFRCNRDSDLVEVRTCWTKAADNSPAQRRDCSSSVLGETNCPRAVYIRSF